MKWKCAVLILFGEILKNKNGEMKITPFFVKDKTSLTQVNFIADRLLHLPFWVNLISALLKLSSALLLSAFVGFAVAT